MRALVSGRTGASRSRSQARGVAMVEMAVGFPIFALMVFGLLDVGRLVYVDNAVAQGAREGSRYGSVAARSRTAGGRAQVATWTAGKLSAVPSPTVTVTCQRDGTTVSTCRTGDILVVTVTSTVTMVTPVIGQIVGSRTVSGESRVQVQQ